MPRGGGFRPSGLAALPVGIGGRMLPDRGARSSRERGLRGGRVLHGQCPAKDEKGSPVAAGRERMRVPRGSPFRAGRGERGLSRGRGSSALTFLHAGAERPPRLALPVFEQSFPDWIWGKKRRRWSGGRAGARRDRDPPAPTRGQRPRSPRPLPLACPAAAAKPGNASRKKEIRFPTQPGKLLNRNRKSRGLG